MLQLSRVRGAIPLRSGLAALLAIGIASSAGTPVVAQQTPELVIETPRSKLSEEKAPAKKPQFFVDELLISYRSGLDIQQVIAGLKPEFEKSGQKFSNVSVVELIPGMAVLRITRTRDGTSTSTNLDDSTTRRVMQFIRGTGAVESVERNFISNINEDRLNRLINPDEPAGSGSAPPRSGTTALQPGGAPPVQVPVAIDRSKVQSRGVFPSDPMFKYQWHLLNYGRAFTPSALPGGTNFSAIWSKRQVRAVTIAIVDSGIVANHPDIDKSRILPGYDFVHAKLEVVNDGTPGPDSDPTEPPNEAIPTGKCPRGNANFHGTHVAGIAGAAKSNNGIGIAGSAWNARILPIRVMNKCGSGDILSISIGILWAAGAPIKGLPVNKNPANIINLSLGQSGTAVGCHPFQKKAIDYAYAKGVVVVSAAGNAGNDVAMTTPASCRNVISVAASDARGYLTNYSNFGANIDIMAPGGAMNRDDNKDGYPDGILSLSPKGLVHKSGTSMAAPLVSAAIANMLSINPKMTPDDVRQALRANARPRNSKQCPRPCGAGLLDVNFSRRVPTSEVRQ
ncbi:MAG: S8 family serine peptidase [Hyphomicrobiaceae bacterium]|nr:S8 family serine peptidase [Hyphomicrobiaceae bacterium]